MDVMIQKCQNCGSRSLRNILSREGRQHVVVQCRDCESFVARYILTSNNGYFHAGSSYESFIRSVERSGGFISGRHLQEKFEETSEVAQEEFESVLQQVKDKYGDELP